MWVKICANTTVEDALLAAEMGADAVGFVFAPSVRQVTAAQVREIAAALPEGVERVGVFGRLAAQDIARAADTARLTAVQLHGGLDLKLVEELGQLGKMGIEIIHTVHWAVGENSAERVAADLAALTNVRENARVLVDAKVGKASGGLGVAYDWAQAATVLRGQAGLRVIVAGGLRPETVAEAVGVLAPWGVDVASGVEAQPGRKDAAKIRQFIEKARRA